MGNTPPRSGLPGASRPSQLSLNQQSQTSESARLIFSKLRTPATRDRITASANSGTSAEEAIYGALIEPKKPSEQVQPSTSMVDFTAKQQRTITAIVQQVLTAQQQQQPPPPQGPPGPTGPPGLADESDGGGN